VPQTQAGRRCRSQGERGAENRGRGTCRKQWRREVPQTVVAGGAVSKDNDGRPGRDGQPRTRRSHDMSGHGEEEPAQVEDMHSYQEKQVHHTNVLSVNVRLLDM